MQKSPSSDTETLAVAFKLHDIEQASPLTAEIILQVDRSVYRTKIYHHGFGVRSEMSSYR